jgi:hypothetical protein
VVAFIRQSGKAADLFRREPRKVIDPALAMVELVEILRIYGERGGKARIIGLRGKSLGINESK